MAIGIAKNAGDFGRNVSIDFYLENLGDEHLSNLSLSDNLNAVFGAGNYTISSSPSFIDDPGTISLNGGFDGDGNTALISSGTLLIGETAQIKVVIELSVLCDQGIGVGIY